MRCHDHWTPSRMVRSSKIHYYFSVCFGTWNSTIWIRLKVENILECLNCSIKSVSSPWKRYIKKCFFRRWRTNFASAPSTFAISSHTKMSPSEILLLPYVKQPRFYRKPGTVVQNWSLLMKKSIFLVIFGSKTAISRSSKFSLVLLQWIFQWTVNSILTGTTITWPPSLKPIWSRIDVQCQSLSIVFLGALDNRADKNNRKGLALYVNSASKMKAKIQCSYRSSLNRVHWNFPCAASFHLAHLASSKQLTGHDAAALTRKRLGSMTAASWQQN